MNSIYIAARYSRRDEMRAVAASLSALGIRVTSRWLYETSPLNSALRDHSPDYLREIAIHDIQDIDLADAMLFFAEDQNNQPPRGGRHVEFGYALAQQKEIHVIGGMENVFHYIPAVKHHASVEAYLATLTPAAGTPAPSLSSSGQ